MAGPLSLRLLRGLSLCDITKMDIFDDKNDQNKLKTDPKSLTVFIMSNPVTNRNKNRDKLAASL